VEYLHRLVEERILLILDLNTRQSRPAMLDLPQI